MSFTLFISRTPIIRESKSLDNIYLVLLVPFWIFLIIMLGRFFSVYVNKNIIYKSIPKKKYINDKLEQEIKKMENMQRNNEKNVLECLLF